MRKTLNLMALALATAMIAPSAFAQDFTLADLKLGMSQAEVEATMTQNGYEPYLRGGRKSNVETALTFAQKVKQKQGEHFPKNTYEGLQSLSFIKDKREIVSVGFDQYPSGDFVREVNYVLKDRTMSAPQFQTRVFEKYGKPTSSRINPLQAEWVGDQAMTRDNIGSKETLKLKGLGLKLDARITSSDYQKALTGATPKSRGKTSF